MFTSLKSKLALGLAVVSLACAGVATSVTPAYAADKPLLVGTEAGYAPFEYLDAKGNIVGFDIDLTNYICKDMKVTCEIKNQGFDSLIPGVKFKKLDFVIADINITPERAKQVAFSDEYLPGNNEHVFVVLNKNKNKAASTFKNVGYQNGTLAGRYLSQKMKSVKAKSYDTNDLALLELKAGRIDALLVNLEVGNSFVKDPNYTILGKPINDEIFGGGPAIGVNKNNKELLAKINSAIAKAKADGTIAKLKAKYGIE